MLNFNLIITLFWISFALYWFVLATQSKKNARSGIRGMFIRLAILFVLFFLLRDYSDFHFIENLSRTGILASPIVKTIGVIICALGIGFAVWARVHLGKNWGMPMSVKENPELVTSGPYAYLRHPIYTGILLAMLGSALTEGITWLVPFVIFSIYFFYVAKEEEQIMRELFPAEYGEYQKRTKMLVPFIF